MLPIGFLYSNNINLEVLKELTLIKNSKIAKENVEVRAVPTSAKRIANKETIKQVISLYNVEEYNAALYLLTQNNITPTPTITKLKVLLKISNKLSKNESVHTELSFLSSFKFLEFYYINEIYQKLILTDNIEELIEFMKSIKVNLKKPFENYVFTQDEVESLKLTEYYEKEAEREREKVEVLLAIVYENNDSLFESYEIYKKWNNPKYITKTIELMTKIKYRISIVSKTDKKKKKIQKGLKGYKNLDIFKVIKVK